MKLQTLRPALLLALLAGCDTILDVDPINDISEDQAITGPVSARAAVAGIYDGLQSTAYYGGNYVIFCDLSAEDVQHVGTFTTFRQADLNALTADNTTIEGIWDALYRTVGRTNVVIAKVPAVTELDPVERDQMLGEAHFVRALTYHNLVRVFGEQASTGMGVPLILVPLSDIPSAALATRATTGEVYTQILSDLQQAQTLMSVTGATRQGSIGAVRAIRARVLLYQQNWAAAEAEAEAVVAMGYTLAATYSGLFTAEGANTPEDIFRINFSATEFNNIGYYYRAKGAAGGRREVTPSNALLLAYHPTYVPGTPASYTPVDLRGQWNVRFQGTTLYGSKYPTGVGAEDIHVIRFAEILLIKAEAEARQGGAAKLAEAQASVNPIRVRAGLAPLDFSAATQGQAIAAILFERRLELVYEGDRWPDLVRNGLAVTTLGIQAYQQLYPIPLNEIDVAPGLQQNLGY